MKVMLLKDVYKLGHAGDVKEVKAGYGRNYLIPQGLAVLATEGVLKNSERIKTEADARRAELNESLSGVASRLEGTVISFPARAGETGKLFGSITTRMIADTLNDELGMELSHHQIDSQPLRALGEHTVSVRLTIDLVPEINVIVYREGESPASVLEEELDADLDAEPDGDAPEEVVAEADADTPAPPTELEAPVADEEAVLPEEAEENVAEPPVDEAVDEQTELEEDAPEDEAEAD